MRAKVNRILNERGPWWQQEQIAMLEQFDNSEATKLEDETILDATAEKRIERVAGKAAEKSTKAEQR
jgi:hypothetical protein